MPKFLDVHPLKVDSIIRNSLDKVGHNLFGFSDNGGF